MRKFICTVIVFLFNLSAFAQWHSVDTEAPHSEVGLSEILRVIQFYNETDYHCEAETEDGFAPGGGNQECPPHDGDYAPQDWRITISELLRVIQFYNRGGYYACGANLTEDGYCVGPPTSEAGGALPVQMITVPAGSFVMGNTGLGADTLYGVANELPLHTVSLSGYRIGKYELTTLQYCQVLNWASDPVRNYLRTETGEPWSGAGDLYAGEDLQRILVLTHSSCNVEYSKGAFAPKWKVGLPGETEYSMATHPIQLVTWYGAAIYTNWLSEMEGFSPVYDTEDWTADFTQSGYHLPTEAQWERAAAWDGNKHWIYGFMSDTLNGVQAVNYRTSAVIDVNPLGFFSPPVSSPVGWFNGSNISPNGNLAVELSVSPIGAFDMCGNVWEWCHDWYLDTYYEVSPETDPIGPDSGVWRILRGGSWGNLKDVARTAQRGINRAPEYSTRILGFRVAR
jgi:formylglycine-generating enzyme required for sulfatase activity